MICIYCGEEANTREHCPPKAFLQEPYPTDLPVLPACKDCNNGYSNDEHFTKTFLLYLYDVCHRRRTSSSAYSQHIIDVANQYLDDGRLNRRVLRVFTKIAIGHAVYELSEGFLDEGWCSDKSKIQMILRDSCDDAVWNEMNQPVILSTIPELGSRSMESTFVVQNSSQEPLPIMMWHDVENNIYRYICYIDGNQIIVKMIIWDYFFIVVRLENSDE